jgi:hypothetical protein
VVSITTILLAPPAHNGGATSKGSGKGENHQRGLAPSLFFVSGLLEKSVEVVLGNDGLLTAVLEQESGQG